MTRSLQAALDETNRRRAKQLAYNEAHGITPTTIKRNIQDILKSAAEADYVTVDIGPHAPATLTGMDLQAYIGELEKKMRDAAADLEFEEAARLRDEIKRLEDGELGLPAKPSAARANGGGDYKPWKPSATREEKRRAAEAKKRAGARRRRGA
jgi:excinuclease ABC subunit B